MSITSNGHEHEMEPEYGLPEALPEGETILWQGSPDFKSLALGAFHFRKLTVYFGVLLVLRASYLGVSGAVATDVALALLWPAVLSLTALAAVATLAWLSARTTVYTLTDQRLVLRIGIVLTLTFNLPLTRIETAGLRLDGAGSGDIPLSLRGDDRIAWLHLWPHARPWRLTKPEPMLRCVPDAVTVAAKLTDAWGVANQTPTAFVAQRAQSSHSTPAWKPVSV